MTTAAILKRANETTGWHQAKWWDYEKSKRSCSGLKRTRINKCAVLSYGTLLDYLRAKCLDLCLFVPKALFLRVSTDEALPSDRL